MAVERICLTMKEAARLIGVSQPTMMTIVRTEGFPSKKIGRRWIIPRDALMKWLESTDKMTKEV